MRYGGQAQGNASPLVVLIASLAFLVFGAVGLRTELRVRAHGHRVLARVASISRGGRNRSSSTMLRFNTLPGAAAECRLSGVRGEVGTPLWIRYLPESPSTCSTDDNSALHHSAFYLLIAGFGLAGSWSLYRRARSGEPLVRP